MKTRQLNFKLLLSSLILSLAILAGVVGPAAAAPLADFPPHRYRDVFDDGTRFRESDGGFFNSAVNVQTRQLYIPLRNGVAATESNRFRILRNGDTGNAGSEISISLNGNGRGPGFNPYTFTPRGATSSVSP